jgi:beta-N-acetylhexosaminidase
MFRRRRRIAVAVAGVLAVIVASVVVSLSIGSGAGKPPYVLGGTAGTPSVANAAAGTHVRPVGRSVFKPRPAAIALAAKLPLDRQVAQLFMVGVGGTGASGVAVGAVDWGGFVLASSNFVGVGQVSSLISALNSAVSSGGVAPLIAALQEGGPTTAFKGLPPQGEAAIGASGAPALAQAQASLAGRRLLPLGVNMTLAPLADVDTPGGPLSGRLFGTDPALVARYSLAAVRGYAAAGVISAVGHFPGTGDASADPDQMMATVGGSLASLRAHDLVPFAAVAAEAPVILMSNAVYAAFDGVTPAGLLRPAVDLLRNEYGFGGAVMSGDLDAAIQATGGDAGSAALQALKAGDDLIFAGGAAGEQQAAYSAVLAAARSSAAVRARVHDALLHVLTLKVRFGLVR